MKLFFTQILKERFIQKELQINEKILNGFNWRIIEEIKNKAEITQKLV